jgi:leucyl aminopeptidase
VSVPAATVSGVTDLELLTADPTTFGVDALVIAVGQGDDGPVLLADPGLPGAVVERLASSLPLLGVRGGSDEVTRIPAGEGLAGRVLVLTGVGPVGQGETPTHEVLRRAAGAATRTLEAPASVALLLPTDGAAAVAAVAEGALLGAYRFRRYRPAEPEGPARLVLLTPLAGDDAALAAANRARVVAEAVNRTRDLVNTSPRDLFPQAMADEAAALAGEAGISVTTLDEGALREGGYGGLIGVGQGSTRPPRLVRLDYSPARGNGHVALVGKGITFDSGGLSIKPAKAMETMKCDMAGAAAVLHTVLAAAALSLPVRVTGWLALAENMPSGTAQRPSDVITIRGGTTVEVLNTDAEGRLVLADALTAACEEGPDVVVDVATLTGAQMIALGNQVAAAMGTDGVRGRLVQAAQTSGESMWPMPLPEELKSSLKSSVADLANMGERFGGMLVAGIFLQNFVGSTPWGHLDIAGPAFNEGNPRGYTPKGGTGFAVRTLLAFLEADVGEPAEGA